MKNRLWKNWFLVILGFCIMVLPWTGFPGSIKTVLSVVGGFLVILLSFSLARSSGATQELEIQVDEQTLELFADDSNG